MSALNEKTISSSKTKLSFLVLGAIAFVLIGLWMLNPNTHQSLGKHALFSQEWAYVIAVIGIVFFGFCGLVGVKKMLDPAPGVVLNSLGILDNSSGVSSGFILWSEIVRIDEARVVNQSFVSIYVNNPLKYIDNGNLVQRFFKRANAKLYGTPIHLTANSLKVNHQELLSLCKTYWNTYKK